MEAHLACAVHESFREYVEAEPLTRRGCLGARPIQRSNEPTPSDTPVGTSSQWLAVLKRASRVAATETTTCLQGESGTGKEVVARFIHAASPRGGGPFVAINCAALPESLLESELFGFERGAFTGAQQPKPGQ